MEEKKGIASVMVKGFIVGSTMMVPGVSGGSMAMILGIYDRLISSLSSFFSDWKGNLLYLAAFSVPSVLGIVLCADPITSVIDRFPIVSMFFFFGLVFGSVPMLLRKADIASFRLKHAVALILGAAAVIAMSYMPHADTAAVSMMDARTFILQVITGIVVAIGFILPGISTSYLLLLLGTYDFIMEAIASLNVIALLPLAIGFVAGTAALTRVLEMCMQRLPGLTYMLITGFLLGSVYTVYPGNPHGWDILFSAAAFAVGFIIIFIVSRLEARVSEEN